MISAGGAGSRDDRLAVIRAKPSPATGGDELLSFIGRLTGDIKNLLRIPPLSLSERCNHQSAQR